MVIRVLFVTFRESILFLGSGTVTRLTVKLTMTLTVSLIGPSLSVLRLSLLKKLSILLTWVPGVAIWTWLLMRTTRLLAVSRLTLLW